MEPSRRSHLPGGLLLLVLALLPPCLTARDLGEKFKAPPPDNMQLLPGYEHWSIQGIDTTVGEIVKGDRVVIRYDIGPLAGERVRPEERKSCMVYEEKKVNGQTARYCFSPHRVYVTFVETTANFTARPEDDAELINVLTMLQSYRPEAGSSGLP